jgi:hypothetical protein
MVKCKLLQKERRWPLEISATFNLIATAPTILRFTSTTINVISLKKRRSKWNRFELVEWNVSPFEWRVHVAACLCSAIWFTWSRQNSGKVNGLIRHVSCFIQEKWMNGFVAAAIYKNIRMSISFAVTAILTPCDQCSALLWNTETWELEWGGIQSAMVQRKVGRTQFLMNALKLKWQLFQDWK